MLVKCPACGREVEFKDNPYRPFCSAACKGKDFLSWTDEEYSIAGEEVHEDDEQEE